MRLAHPRPAAVALVAGSVLFTAVSGVSFAAAATTAAAATSAAAPPGKQSCEPLQLPAASPSPSATPTTTSHLTRAHSDDTAPTADANTRAPPSAARHAGRHATPTSPASPRRHPARPRPRRPPQPVHIHVHSPDRIAEHHPKHHAGQPLRRGHRRAGEQRARQAGPLDGERLDHGRHRDRGHRQAAGDPGRQAEHPSSASAAASQTARHPVTWARLTLCQRTGSSRPS